MKLVSLGMLALLLSGMAAADEARILLPKEFAPRLACGEVSGAVVSVEARGNAVLVTVRRQLSAFPPSLVWPEEASKRWLTTEYTDVPIQFTLPKYIENTIDPGASAIEIVLKVVAFVADEIKVDRFDNGPQDAQSVLNRGRGRCSGRANLSVGLLRAKGIAARVVSGLVVSRTGAVWHRWGEAWLGSLGWVEFDPAAAVGTVDANYIRLRGAGEWLLLREVELISLDNPVYRALPVRAGLRVVPVGGATVRCRPPAGDVTSHTITLCAEDESCRHASFHSEAVFSHLLPGKYQLRWQSGGTLHRYSLAVNGTKTMVVDLVGATKGGA